MKTQVNLTLKLNIGLHMKKHKLFRRIWRHRYINHCQTLLNLAREEARGKTAVIDSYVERTCLLLFFPIKTLSFSVWTVVRFSVQTATTSDRQRKWSWPLSRERGESHEENACHKKQKTNSKSSTAEKNSQTELNAKTACSKISKHGRRYDSKAFQKGRQSTLH